MRRNNNLRFWICVFLAIASVAWLLNIAMWYCHHDPGGVASSLIPEDMTLGQAALMLRQGSDTCLFVALTLLAAGFIEEETQRRPSCRRLQADRITDRS